MTIGQIKSAERRALNILDKWLECTGVIQKDTSYYYELVGVVEDAVKCGAQSALGVNEELESEVK